MPRIRPRPGGTREAPGPRATRATCRGGSAPGRGGLRRTRPSGERPRARAESARRRPTTDGSRPRSSGGTRAGVRRAPVRPRSRRPPFAPRRDRARPRGGSSRSAGTGARGARRRAPARSPRPSPRRPPPTSRGRSPRRARRRRRAGSPSRATSPRASGGEGGSGSGGSGSRRARPRRPAGRRAAPTNPRAGSPRARPPSTSSPGIRKRPSRSANPWMLITAPSTKPEVELARCALVDVPVRPDHGDAPLDPPVVVLRVEVGKLVGERDRRGRGSRESATFDLREVERPGWGRDERVVGSARLGPGAPPRRQGRGRSVAVGQEQPDREGRDDGERDEPAHRHAPRRCSSALRPSCRTSASPVSWPYTSTETADSSARKRAMRQVASSIGP